LLCIKNKFFFSAFLSIFFTLLFACEQNKRKMDINLLNALNDAENVLILTANRRLVRYWQTEYTRLQQAKGRCVFESPMILSLNAWLIRLFQQHRAHSSIVLSEWQTWLLWKQAVDKVCQHSAFAHDKLITPMMEAWNRLFLYGTSPLEEHFNMHDTGRVFAQCAQYVQNMCQQNSWMTVAQLPSFLSRHFPKDQISQPMYLIGFLEDQMPSTIRDFLNQCQAHVSVSFVDVPEQSSNIRRYAYPHPRQELYNMVYWAVSTWQRFPNRRIACLILNLDQQRERILTVFEEIFIRLKVNERPLNISMGKPLSEYPLIRTALHWLCLPHQSMIHLQDILSLLHDSQGMLHDAAVPLDQKLKDQFSFSFSKEQLLSFLIKHFPHAALTTYWESYLSRFEHNAPRTLQYWVGVLTKHLHLLQWGRALSADDKQVMLRFEQSMAEFVQADRCLMQPILLKEALQLLKIYLNQVIFQPSGATHASPIQVLGLLEALGHAFDAVWIMGLDEYSWPMPLKFNPFLPSELQQKLAMPHASPQQELLYAKKLQRYFTQHAGEMVVSHALSSDERIQHSSALIRDIPLSDAVRIIDCIESVVQSGKMETIDESHPLPVNDPARVRGGCTVLKEQALCPFRAFAHFRLQVNELNQPVMGITSCQHGQWIHAALEYFWNHVGTRTCLVAMSDQALRQVIEQSVFQTQKVVLHPSNTLLSSFFLDSQIKYLNQLLWQWMAKEKQREPFKVVLTETQCYVRMGKLGVKVRMDRIDQLADGSFLVIDYKTGKTDYQHWLRHPLREPQLPLYCVFGLHDAMISGIAFAELSDHDVRFNGISDTPLNIAGVRPVHKIKHSTMQEWNQLRAYWAEQLLILADNFCQGVRDVAPIEPSVCQSCDLKALCRIDMVA
jgi:ATP-dependent helicase/nuclease subunit B